MMIFIRACRFGLLLRGARKRAALSAATVVAACSVVGGFTGVAAASSAFARVAGGARPGQRSGLTLAQAPAGLRAAVRRTLGVPDAAQSSPLQQAKLTASDGAAGNEFGYSVAIYESTAIAGAIGVDSWTGAAYVFSGV